MASYDWIDRTAYPFTSRWLDVDAGRLHYVDEGQGQPIVMVHGGGQTGSGWISTPDGREGWAQYFLHVRRVGSSHPSHRP